MARIHVELEHWIRIAELMHFRRIPNTKSKTKSIPLHNYIQPIDPPNPYPRLHVIVVPQFKGRCKLEIHVDIIKHKETSYLHPKIDKLINVIKHC